MAVFVPFLAAAALILAGAAIAVLKPWGSGSESAGAFIALLALLPLVIGCAAFSLAEVDDDAEAAYSAAFRKHMASLPASSVRAIAGDEDSPHPFMPVGRTSAREVERAFRHLDNGASPARVYDALVQRDLRTAVAAEQLRRGRRVGLDPIQMPLRFPQPLSIRPFRPNCGDDRGQDPGDEPHKGATDDSREWPREPEEREACAKDCAK